ncbi:MAG: hypothetical protein SFU98_02955 [Leptospiraceae bacterium]|nr:hypothetical protein [Leptospiraceae bacterium]
MKIVAKNLLLILLVFTFGCLKAKKSAFDLSNKSSSLGPVGLFLASVKPTTSSSTETTEEAAPSNITYPTSTPRKLIPGQTLVIPPPTVSGKVESWSIAPLPLPSWVSFNTSTGEITINTPSTPPSQTESYVFTITATNASGSVSATVPIERLGTGANVWTVMNGVSGADTKAGTNSMKYDSTCNCLYLGGATTGNLDGQTLTTTGSERSAFLSKFDLDGNRIWTRVFGIIGSSTNYTNALGITNDSVGNIYVTGIKSSGNFMGCTSSAIYTGYVVKYDPQGNFQWTTCTGTSHRHYYTGLLVDNNGDIVAAGTTYDNGIDGMNHSSTTDQAGIIQKFNPNTGARITGTIIPGNTARGTDIYGVAKDSTGKIYLAVATRASAYCGDGTVNWRPALFRYDTNISYLGCTPISSASVSVYSFGATATPSGESYLSGYVEGAVPFDGYANIGTVDGYFTKFNNTGIKQWTRRIGVTGNITAINSTYYDPSEDKLYITGTTGGNLQGNTIVGTKDMFVAKYDSNGNQIWLKMQGVQNDTISAHHGDPTSITFDNNKTLYSFGETNGTVAGVSNPATPNRSYFLVRNVQ